MWFLFPNFLDTFLVKYNYRCKQKAKATILLLSLHCMLGSAVLPDSPSESLNSNSSSVNGFRQLWWSPNAWWRRVLVGTTPSAATRGPLVYYWGSSLLFCVKTTQSKVVILLIYVKKQGCNNESEILPESSTASTPLSSATFKKICRVERHML